MLSKSNIRYWKKDKCTSARAWILENNRSTFCVISVLYWSEHTFAFCENASRSSVWRFFQASPSSTLIALKFNNEWKNIRFSWLVWLLGVDNLFMKYVRKDRILNSHPLLTLKRQELIFSALVCMVIREKSSDLSAFTSTYV